MNLLTDVAHDTEKYIELLEKQLSVVTQRATEATQQNDAIREETSNLHKELDRQQQLNEERKRSKDAVSTTGYSISISHSHKIVTARKVKDFQN